MCCQGAHDGLPTCYAAEDQRQRRGEHELHSIDSDVIAGVDLTTTGTACVPFWLKWLNTNKLQKRCLMYIHYMTALDLITFICLV
jgi:hypothetical protein